MPTPQDIIKEMLSILHQSFLKTEGFRKTGKNWIRHGKWPQAINIQLGKYNSSTDARFTINLGISVGELHTLAERMPFSGNPIEPDCDLRRRIGELIPPGLDKWWSVTGESSAGQLAKEVHADLSEYAMPWFNKMNNFETLAEEFSKGSDRFLAALAYYLAGDKLAAKETMLETYSWAHPLALPLIRRVSTKCGIHLPDEPVRPIP